MSTEADPNNTTHLSSPPRYTDEPPRLSTCLSELLLGEDRTAEDADVPALVPDGTKLLSPDGAGWASTAVQWVTDVLLHRKVSEAWDTDAARNDIVDANDPEEKWARAVEERFFGHAYGGPNITAQFPKLSPREGNEVYESYDEDCAAEECRSPDIAQKMVLYIYQRFQPWTVNWQQANDDNQWWKGPPESISWESNDDPCYSIWMACQYLATYINLARGFNVEEHFNRAGFGAGQCGHIRIFNMDGGGKWFSTAGTPPEGSKWATVSSKELFVPHHYDVADEAGAPLGPGTIFTFNPYGDTKSKLVRVPKSVCKWDDASQSWVVDQKNKAALRVELASAQAVKDNNKQVDADTKLKKGLEAAANYIGLPGLGSFAPVVAPKAGEAKMDPAKDGDVTAVPPDPTKPNDPPPAQNEELVEATLVFHAQVPGSHIFAVLRNWKNKKGERVFQVLDTNSHPQTARKPGDKTDQDAVAREYAAWKRTSNGGIYCGQYLGVVPLSNGNRFVGMGTMPSPGTRSLEEMTAHLMKCRPVGLARLVLTLPERWNPKLPGMPPELTAADVMYVSRAALMWGPGEEDNYPISQYLLSLSNMPYYKSLQAFWLIYAPCEELARVMFAKGARSKTLDELVDEATELRRRRNDAARDPKAKKPYPPKFYNYTSIKLTTILSHDANGKPQVVWRGNDLQGTTGQGSPPKPIKTLFMDTSFAYMPEPKKLDDMQRAQRDILAEYVHPKFQTGDVSQFSAPAYLTQADPMMPELEANRL